MARISCSWGRQVSRAADPKAEVGRILEDVLTIKRVWLTPDG
jgi:hypothetical protein